MTSQDGDIQSRLLQLCENVKARVKSGDVCGMLMFTFDANEVALTYCDIPGIPLSKVIGSVELWKFNEQLNARRLQATKQQQGGR
jgi:hypothetical protein